MQEQLYNLYYNEGKSLEDIGTICGVSRQTVRNWLEKYQIPRRTRSEARLLALQKGKFADKDYHDFNRRFFDQWSPTMAYLLGLVFADGHVRHIHEDGRADHYLHFGFHASSELPLIINRLLVSKKPPLNVMSNGQPQLRLSFGDEQLVHRLLDLGVPPGKKSHNMPYPSMPLGFDRHFIRGFFDGDGGIYRASKKKQGNGRFPIQIRFYSSSPTFLNGIAQCLSLCGFTGHIYGEANRTHDMPQGNALYVEGAYRLVYSRWHDCLELFDFFYDDVPDGQFLPIKKNKFQGLIHT